MPEGTPTRLIQHQNRSIDYVVGGPIATEIAMVNLGCIAVHVWGSRASHPQQPDWVVFDIDPSSGEFADAARAGLLVKDALEALDLVSFPKTSGGRGMHVFLPIEVGPDFDEARSFAEEVGKRLAEAHPDILTVEQRLKVRAIESISIPCGMRLEPPWWRLIRYAAARKRRSRCRCDGRMSRHR